MTEKWSAIKARQNDITRRKAMTDKHFVVSDDHLKLLKEMSVSWDDTEFGAPAIDCKRPYGNGDVIGDMREILGRPPWDLEDTDYPDRDELTALHHEMQTVLQILLQQGQLHAGGYTAPQYGGFWKKTRPVLEDIPRFEDHGVIFEGEGLEHLREDAPFQICDVCGRHTWSVDNFDGECGMTQPDSSSCGGIFRDAGQIAAMTEDGHRSMQDSLPPSEPPDGLLYTAWGIIANAYEGNWEKASLEWQGAAERWRDEWHEYLRGGTAS